MHVSERILLLLGPWISVVVAAVALLIQALVLSHGGITTLGPNVMSMGIRGASSSERLPLMTVLLYKKRPDLLVSMRVIKAEEVGA